MSSGAHGQSSDVHIEGRTVSIGGRNYRLKIVSASLSDYNVKIGVARDTIGATSSLKAIAMHNGAQAAINGGFFNAYTSSTYKTPYMTLISRGEILYANTLGVTLGFNSKGDYRLERAVFSRNQQKLQYAETPDFWAGVQEALACGPLLLKNGNISVNPAAEGFKQDKIVSLRARRSAVGITGDLHIFFVICDSATMKELAAVMQSLGALDAMNLDGGSSSGLWANGRYITSPGRLISNALMLVPKGGSSPTTWINSAGVVPSQEEVDHVAGILTTDSRIYRSYSGLLEAYQQSDKTALDKLLDSSFKRQYNGTNPGRDLVLSALTPGEKPTLGGTFYLKRVQPYDGGSRVAVTGVCATAIPGVGSESSMPPVLFEHVWKVDPGKDQYTLLYEQLKNGDEGLAESLRSWPRGLVIQANILTGKS